MLRALPRGAAMDKALETSPSIMFSAVEMNRVSLTAPTTDFKFITLNIPKMQELAVQVNDMIINMILRKTIMNSSITVIKNKTNEFKKNIDKFYAVKSAVY